MRKIASSFFLLVVCTFAVSVAAQTAEEIVGRHIAAVGGAKKMRALTTQRISGYLEAPGVHAEFVEIKKRPIKLRREVRPASNVLVVEGYDGHTAWKIVPGRAAAETIQGDELQELLDGSEFDENFLDYEQRGIKIELIGTDKVKDADVFHLKVTRKDGQVTHSYLDSKTYLELRTTGRRGPKGQEHDFDSYPSDYRDVKGFKLAFAGEHHSLRKNGERVLNFKMSSVEFDLPIDDSIFQMPTAK
jgi:hypothetical protein